MRGKYSYIDADALNSSSSSLTEKNFSEYESRIKNRIDVLRKQGYSEDDILLILIDERCNPKSNDNEKSDSKRFTYTYDFNKR